MFHFKSSEMVLKYEETTWLERPFEESEVLEPGGGERYE